MKKTVSLMLALVLCFTFCVPAFAVTPEENDDLPPWVEEGETWHPANGIMPLEDMDGCAENHRPPSGYVYQGYTSGNTVFEVAIETVVIYLFAKYIPDFGNFVSMIDNALTVEWIKNSVENGHILSNYDKYVYTKGDNYYYHIIWYYRADDGLFRQITCAVKTHYSN